jgi:hypothetical protein
MASPHGLVGGRSTESDPRVLLPKGLSIAGVVAFLSLISGGFTAASCSGGGNDGIPDALGTGGSDYCQAIQLPGMDGGGSALLAAVIFLAPALTVLAGTVAAVRLRNPQVLRVSVALGVALLAVTFVLVLFTGTGPSQV